ncbi:uncharacterized protein [Nicotiana tomentosiformis]|uniref:uncharacterized protein n=1 Tax=Nicotiana tomentosiformis TaxID=4098 RepID=UPI00388CD294
MYHDLKEVYWWNDMKKNVEEFVARFPNCQQVKDEHKRPGGLAQNIDIPMWKWKMINMDFVKVVGDPTLIVPIEAVEVNEKFTYEEIPIYIIDRQVQKLRNKEIASVNMLWQNQHVEEDTWEAEEEMNKKYPYMFE